MPMISELDILQARGGHCGNGHLTSSGIAASEAQHPIRPEGRGTHFTNDISVEMLSLLLTVHDFSRGRMAILLLRQKGVLCQ